MAKIRIEYDISKCWDCPKCITEPTPTPDSFEEAYDYYCSLNNKKLAGYVEHAWEMPEVPDWYPLLVSAD